MPTTPGAVRVLQDAGVGFGPGKAADGGGAATVGAACRTPRATDGPSTTHGGAAAGAHAGVRARCCETAEEYGRPGDLVPRRQRRRLAHGGQRPCTRKGWCRRERTVRAGGLVLRHGPVPAGPGPGPGSGGGPCSRRDRRVGCGAGLHRWLVRRPALARDTARPAAPRAAAAGGAQHRRRVGHRLPASLASRGRAGPAARDHLRRAAALARPRLPPAPGRTWPTWLLVGRVGRRRRGHRPVALLQPLFPLQ